MTFDDIGREIGCSRARAQQIFADALAKLRNNPQVLQLLLLAKSKEYEG